MAHARQEFRLRFVGTLRSPPSLLKALQQLRAFGVAIFVLSFAFVLDLGFGPSTDEARAFLAREASGDAVKATFSSDLPYGPGGYLALAANVSLVDRFGENGLWIVLLTIIGISALLAMLTTCTPGVTTVNIDNGFGAAYAAWLINTPENK